MKRFLIVLSLVVAVAFAFVACHRGTKGPCCPGGAAAAPAMAQCADCPHKDNCACLKGGECKECPKGACQCMKGGACECKKTGVCKCGPGCKCPDCPKGAQCQCSKGGPCTCPAGCTCAHCKELKQGPVGAPEGAPAKK